MRAVRHPRRRDSKLLRHLYHVIDGLLDEVVGRIHAAALRGHHAGFPLEALERVLVEHGLALGDARSPGGFVPRLRRAADPLSMADVARLLEELRTVLWHPGGDRRARRPALGSPLRRLDGERRGVAPGNRLVHGRTAARGAACGDARVATVYAVRVCA